MPINKERVFAPPKEILRPNEIPPVSVYGLNLPEAWENAIMVTLEYGCSMPTQYDNEFDPESKVVSMSLMVTDPFAEPRIHKSIPAGLEDLQVYMHEVANGAHGERVEGWAYSYYDRLFNWPGKVEKIMTGEILEIPHVNQIEELVNRLADTPFTRRAQAITWYPLIDSRHHEPPCLQRIWCQVVKSGEDYVLEMNTHWRSRDAFKASFMNIFALTQLQKNIAEMISQKTGKKIKVGRYCDFSDNFHVYGSYLRKGEMDGFLHNLEKRTFEQRTYRSDDFIVQQEFKIADKKVLLESK